MSEGGKLKVLNFGSLNLDYVYSVDHIVRPGETISSSELDVFPGGKGLNQSVALARAGAEVYHAGMIGQDGGLLLQTCEENHIDTSFIRRTEVRSGNAIIQIAKDGENSIVLFAGANRQHTKEHVDSVLACFGKGGLLVLQNEINLIDYIIDRAFAIGMQIAINPSPFDLSMKCCDFSKVSFLFINEVEGEQLSGEKQADQILAFIKKTYPQIQTVLTLGKDGALFQQGDVIYRQAAFDVKAVDTTAAGDTFTGYFLAEITRGQPPQDALRLAAAAAALAVSRKGAVVSIPWKNEIK